MNRAQFWLLLYLVAVVSITFVHHAGWLAGALGVALLAAGPTRWRLLTRAVLALLLFNVSVSLAYALVAWWQVQPVVDVLLLMNLRVLLLVFLGFWLVDRIKLLEALTGWPLLAMIVTLAISQVGVYRRLLDDFRLAFRSRNPVSPTPADLLRHAGAQGGALLDKSLHSADQVAQAMRSRGTFDA